MAKVLSATAENLDLPEAVNTKADNNNKKPSISDDAGPCATSTPASPPPPPPRRGIRDREQDSRERHDDQDLDRPPPPRREDYDRNQSPPPSHSPRERDYHKRGRPSPSPPPLYRDRRGGPHSPLLDDRPLSHLITYKRRRDDGFGGRRGSPRGGYGPGDRRKIAVGVEGSMLLGV